MLEYTGGGRPRGSEQNERFLARFHTKEINVFDDLERINLRPKAFEFYTASDLWTDAHTSGKMLSFHLNQEIDVASRRAAFIDRSVEWIASRFNVGAGTKIADFGCGPGLYALQLAAVFQP